MQVWHLLILKSLLKLVKECAFLISYANASITFPHRTDYIDSLADL